MQAATHPVANWGKSALLAASLPRALDACEARPAVLVDPAQCRFQLPRGKVCQSGPCGSGTRKNGVMWICAGIDDERVLDPVPGWRRSIGFAVGCRELIDPRKPAATDARLGTGHDLQGGPMTVSLRSGSLLSGALASETRLSGSMRFVRTVRRSAGSAMRHGSEQPILPIAIRGKSLPCKRIANA
jgi:hypothetical protein